MAASQQDPVQRFHQAIDPNPRRTYPVQRPEQHRVLWGCPWCGAEQHVAVVTRRDARDGVATVAWVRCPECAREREFRLTNHALERWCERVGHPVHALRALVEAVHVGRPHVDQPARIHPPTATLLPVEVERSGRNVVAKTVKCPIYGRGRLVTDHLAHCRTCDQMYDPARTASCPWCRVSIDYQTATTEQIA